MALREVANAGRSGAGGAHRPLGHRIAVFPRQQHPERLANDRRLGDPAAARRTSEGNDLFLRKLDDRPYHLGR